MNYDLIDFPTSTLWANYYADKGMTRNYDSAGHRQDLNYYDQKVRQARQEAESARILDEEYFRDQERNQGVQAQYRKYEERIEAMERHIDHLQAKIPSQDTDVPFRGIPATSAWTETESDDEDDTV